MFRKRGYTATTMRDIAREVGMEPASLYNHIRSKQDILESALMHLANLYNDSIQNTIKQNIPPIKKLEQLIIDQIDITINNVDAVSLVPSEWVHLEQFKGKFIDRRNEYESSFKLILKQAVKDNDLRSLDIELTTFSILSTLRYLHSWYSRNKEMDIENLKNELSKNLLEGIKN